MSKKSEVKLRLLLKSLQLPYETEHHAATSYKCFNASKCKVYVRHVPARTLFTLIDRRKLSIETKEESDTYDLWKIPHHDNMRLGAIELYLYEHV
jgi:hypothetical protein